MPRIIKDMSARFTAAAKVKDAAKTDTLAAVTKLLGANFGNIEVGGGMAFPVKDGEDGKKKLASIRAKLVSVVRTGEPWAGRVYRTRYDEAANEVLTMREEDGTPLPKKVGGRAKGTSNKPKESPAVIAGITAARAHLSGGDKTTTEIAGDVEKVKEIKDTEPKTDDKTETPPVGDGRSKVKDLTGGKNKDDKPKA